jgi:hypothetical protein
MCYECNSKNIEFGINDSENGWVCLDCDAYTPSVSSKVKNPRGLVCHKDLHDLQEKVYAYVEALVQRKHFQKFEKLDVCWEKCYKWLHGEMGIEDKRITAYKMDRNQVAQAIKILSKYFKHGSNN